MQRIRLTRIGKKKRPFYRIVVTPQQNAVKGKFTSIVGNFDPMTKKLSIDKDSILNWLNMGAIPSNTVSKLLLEAGLKHKLIVFKKAPKISKKELAAQKAADEAEKEKLAAEKEAAKAEWEEKSAEIAEEHAQEVAETEAEAETTEAESADTAAEEDVKPDNEVADK
ncbi:MAG: 30S ribosomal protein S16 [Patescibacteria group bacterium]